MVIFLFDFTSRWQALCMFMSIYNYGESDGGRERVKKRGGGGY